MYRSLDKSILSKCGRSLALLVLVILLLPLECLWSQKQTVESPLLELVRDYCVSCHNPEKKKGKLDLESILEVDMAQHSDTWAPRGQA